MAGKDWSDKVVEAIENAIDGEIEAANIPDIVEDKLDVGDIVQEILDNLDDDEELKNKIRDMVRKKVLSAIEDDDIELETALLPNE